MVNDGEYTLKNVNSGLFIAYENGNAVQSSDRNWTIKSVGDGAYSIQSEDGRALTVENGSAENGANISLDTYSGSSSQKFTLKANRDGSYSLMSVVSDGKACVDVFEISAEDGANINQWEYWGGDGQKFIIEPASIEKKTVIGDVNADGTFSIADVVLLQKWLLAVPNVTLPNWKAADLCEDGRLDVFDLCMMKRLLLNS